MAKLLDAIAERVLLSDGGIGSRVQQMDLDVTSDYWGAENCTEVLNLSRPDIIRDIHRGYLAAGSDVIVMGTHGHSGFKKLLLGSVAGRVVSGARCPVMTVHGK